jgi:hypothetical protein
VISGRIRMPDSAADAARMQIVRNRRYGQEREVMPR